MLDEYLMIRNGNNKLKGAMEQYYQQSVSVDQPFEYSYVKSGAIAQPHGKLDASNNNDVSPLSAPQALSKRAFDICCATMLLAASLPVMLLVALLVKLDLKEPVIFKQQRTGMHGKAFTIYKFRTMRTPPEVDEIRQHTMPDDPQLTTVGRILRNLSLDELPQFINVIKGDMSLVGPRPQAVYHTEYYEQHLPEFHHRHHVRPGITGLVQISDMRNQIETVNDMRQRVAMDIDYIRNWSLIEDIRICVMTIVRTVIKPQPYPPEK